MAKKRSAQLALPGVGRRGKPKTARVKRKQVKARKATNVVPIKKSAVEVLPPSSSPRKAWAKLITATWRETVEGIVKVGQMLVAASPMKKNMEVSLPRGVDWPERLDDDEFKAMVESDLPFNKGTISKLMSIGRDPRISKVSHVKLLPPSWGTLYVLSKLDDEQWEKGIAEGVINPGMERGEVAALWYKSSRQKRHRGIAAEAHKGMELSHFGPFPLIYADPPWKFETYSEQGLGRTPDQHYDTLTDEQICKFEVMGKLIKDIAHKDAALLLWCTSSNFDRALAVVKAWDFEYKTHAVWDKMRGGTGLVFRNWHEPLIYATRGNMPGPQYQPPSIFRFPRGEHSAKPSEIRAEIEKMYPDFDEKTRLELFSRGSFTGWSSYGYEAFDHAAA